MLIARDYSRKSGAKVLLFLHICKKKCEKGVKFWCFVGFIWEHGGGHVRFSLVINRVILRVSYVYPTYMVRISYVIDKGLDNGRPLMDGRA